jgi:uncharacterized RDD family membrane protein YckC
MTQQDETDQSVATDQSVPPRPSPYLDASESAPQAYLAPPQPGQPRYGIPPTSGPRLRTDGSGSQPYAGPGLGQQPGNGQAPYGQARNRPFPGSQSRRDPSVATLWERLAAAVFDWFIIAGISVLVFWSPLVRVWHEFEAITSNYRDLSSPAAQAAINNMARDPANQHALLYWFLGVFGIALVYYWLQHAAWGATVGKRITGVRVVRAADHGRIGVQAAGIRTVALLVGPAAFLLVASPVNVVGGLLWVADSGLMLLDPRAQCLHDKVARTAVVKKRWLDQQARSADS